jgi:hypothetical protein
VESRVVAAQQVSGDAIDATAGQQTGLGIKANTNSLPMTGVLNSGIGNNRE